MRVGCTRTDAISLTLHGATSRVRGRRVLAAKSGPQATSVAIDMLDARACVQGAADAMGALLREMHQSGALQPGRTKPGEVDAKSRGDLMAWVPATAAQPAALRALLSALDNLVLDLAKQPCLAADLGAVSLLRAEAQCTCYPGGGSRYVRHTDDARRCSRRLTCILYTNPEWTDADGGALRLHVKGGAVKRGGRGVKGGGVVDVLPMHNRLVLFWSDARVPHEVRPTHAPRYAVSVWYHDAASHASSCDAASHHPCTLATLLAQPPRSAAMATALAKASIALEQISRRGLGLIAKRSFAAGERLFAESPLVTWRVRVDGAGRADLRSLDATIAKLDAEAHDAFFSLINVHGSSLAFDTAAGTICLTGGGGGEGAGGVGGGSGAGGGAQNGCDHEKTVASIWASNAFHLEQGDCFTPADDDDGGGGGTITSAVFQVLSRLNHACRPSCYTAWNPILGKQTLHALRDIPAGEELCIACACPNPQTTPHPPTTSIHHAPRARPVCACDRTDGPTAAPASTRFRRISLPPPSIGSILGAAVSASCLRRVCVYEHVCSCACAACLRAPAWCAACNAAITRLDRAVRCVVQTSGGWPSTAAEPTGRRTSLASIASRASAHAARSQAWPWSAPRPGSSACTSSGTRSTSSTHWLPAPRARQGW